MKTEQHFYVHIVSQDPAVDDHIESAFTDPSHERAPGATRDSVEIVTTGETRWRREARGELS